MFGEVIDKKKCNMNNDQLENLLGIQT